MARYLQKDIKGFGEVKIKGNKLLNTCGFINSKYRIPNFHVFLGLRLSLVWLLLLFFEMEKKTR